MGDANLNDSNVKVAVRVRPMNRREKDLNTKCVVEMEGNQTFLYSTNLGKDSSRGQPKTFAYDYCFWSMDESETEKFAGQFLEALLYAARLFMPWFSTKYFICIFLF